MKKKLTLIDFSLEQFVKSRKGILKKDETKGMWLPDRFESREISWTKDKLNYGIGIYPEIEEDKIKNWVFYYCCFYDSATHRFYKKETLVSSRKIEDIYASINSLLSKAYEDLKTWSKEDLPAVVELNKS